MSNVKCKSRKRRRSNLPININTPKEFCPPTIVRINDTVLEGYSTIFVCKMCKAILLSESAVIEHIAKCKAVTRVPVHVKNDGDDPYICEVCNKMFSRAVTLKKHKEVHNKSNSEQEFEFTTGSPKKKKKKRSAITPPNLELIADEANVENAENV